MKTIVILRQLFVSTALIWLAGCASGPGKSAAKTSPAAKDQAVASSASRPAFDDALRKAAASPTEPFEGEGWQSLFDGQTLTGWKATDFAGRGEVECRAGLMVFNMGDPFTGVNGTNAFPKMNYEIALDAMRVGGSDFFCGLTVPVGDTFCSLIVGGWGGTLVGISSLDGMDASENETTKFINLESGHWYRVRLRITEKKIEAWIDKDKVADVITADKKVTVRPGDIEMSEPFGIASWQTAAAFREIKVRKLPAGK
jgi:hypothetical protein